ncbi:MAG: tetratricopeptide repeat protein [Anaerolineae bacterium]
MSAEMTQKLVQGGIKAVRNGEPELARKAFTQALKLDPNNEAAWLGMATITDDEEARRRILTRVLEINPDNERAQEALRRLSPEPQVEPEPPDLEQADYTPEALDDPFTSGEIAPLRDAPSGDTGQLSEFPKPDWALDEDLDGLDILPADATPDEPVTDAPARMQTLEIRRSEDLFSALPALSVNGQDGIPIPDPAVVDKRRQQTQADVQAYLESALADYLTPTVNWRRKTSRRAGSGEYRNLLLQLGAGAFVSVMIVSVLLVSFLLTNATARNVLFAPTAIPSSTPTNTPTATPGVTNTPSPTPLIPATETPALPFSATLGVADPNFPPTPTEIYYPQSVNAESLLDEALLLMQDGELEDARERIDRVLEIESATGEFPATARLSEWHLLNDDPESARDVLDEWQEEWEQDAGLFDNSESLLLIAQARVDLYEARNNLGDRAFLLDRAQDRLEASLGLATGDNQIIVPDRFNTEGYLLLAEAFALRNNIDGALEVLDNALAVSTNTRSLLGDTELRMAVVRLLIEDQRYDEAFQQLYFTLQFDPFLEEALILQTELALQTNQPGFAVLSAEQYLLYYPGSLRGFYLLGQAREAENKFDLALNAYSRALAGDTDNETYTDDPFFLENLLARAELLTQQGERDRAADDLSLALEVGGDDPEIRVRRLRAAYAAGDYDAVLTDADQLLDERGVNQSQVLYYQGLALIAQAQAGIDANTNYDLAIEALTSALSRNLTLDLRPDARENLAQAHYEARNYAEALDAINSALDSEITGERLYLRALIYEAQGDRQRALLDYEYLVTWGQYLPMPFFDDAQTRYETLVRQVGLR